MNTNFIASRRAHSSAIAPITRPPRAARRAAIAALALAAGVALSAQAGPVVVGQGEWAGAPGDHSGATTQIIAVGVGALKTTPGVVADAAASSAPAGEALLAAMGDEALVAPVAPDIIAVGVGALSCAGTTSDVACGSAAPAAKTDLRADRPAMAAPSDWSARRPSTVPEPASLWLALPALLALRLMRPRRL